MPTEGRLGFRGCVHVEGLVELFKVLLIVRWKEIPARLCERLLYLSSHYRIARCTQVDGHHLLFGLFHYSLYFPWPMASALRTLRY